VGTPTAHDRTPPGPHTLKLLLGLIITLIVISTTADMFLGALADTHPLVLMTMNARNRNLILVTNQVDTLPYYLVGTVRLLISDPLFFLLGYWYGDAALEWIEQRTTSYGQLLRKLEGFFARASYPLVFIAPNNFICLFAGAAGMSIPGFLVTNVTGTIARLYLIRRLGDHFESPIEWVLDFIGEYRPYILAVSIPLFAYVMWREVREARQDFEVLEETLEEEAEAEARESREPE
jgi:membrane protein DedA with SNARE-associated domain